MSTLSLFWLENCWNWKFLKYVRNYYFCNPRRTEWLLPTSMKIFFICNYEITIFWSCYISYHFNTTKDVYSSLFWVHLFLLDFIFYCPISQISILNFPLHGSLLSLINYELPTFFHAISGYIWPNIHNWNCRV